MIKKIKNLFKGDIIRNSLWSITSNIIQNIMLSIFFIIIAREYSTIDFSNYIIANTIYSFVLGFSSLGMGHWFIREYLVSDNKALIIDRFFKMQINTGIFFYLVNVAISFILYKSESIRLLSMIMGVNLVFDNIIYVIKSLNIAELEQKRSSFLLAIEAFLKLAVSLFLFIYPFNIVLLCFILILIRFITLNIFIQYGTKNSIGFLKIFSVKINLHHFREIISKNWSFVVISSISVINWRVGNIIVSKFLSISDVANYEISYKLLSISYLIPIMATTSLYPNMITANSENIDNLKNIYHKTFLPMCIYGFISFTFIYSFSDQIIPYLFGNKYSNTSVYCKEMFLVILVFPTIFLQANVLLTLKLEKLDMICNIVCLIINITFSLILLHYYKTLSIVNYSVFFSFVIFHLMQDIILIKKQIITIQQVVRFYLLSTMTIILYIYFGKYFPTMIYFFTFWVVALLLFLYYNKNNKVALITTNIE